MIMAIIMTVDVSLFVLIQFNFSLKLSPTVTEEKFIRKALFN